MNLTGTRSRPREICLRVSISRTTARLSLLFPTAAPPHRAAASPPRPCPTAPPPTHRATATPPRRHPTAPPRRCCPTSPPLCRHPTTPSRSRRSRDLAPPRSTLPSPSPRRRGASRPRATADLSVPRRRPAGPCLHGSLRRRLPPLLQAAPPATPASSADGSACLRRLLGRPRHRLPPPPPRKAAPPAASALSSLAPLLLLSTPALLLLPAPSMLGPLFLAPFSMASSCSSSWQQQQTDGQGLLRRLVAKGISCTYTHINAVSYIMHGATRVFLGTSSVLSNGTVYSRAGTASVAMVAHAFGVPVLVCCEAYKFHERVQLDSICFNELGEPDAISRVLGGESSSHLKNWADNENLHLLNLKYDITPFLV
ncbi:hypothetical protein U9M48_029878 [Paspalum notatum var. saurae]|uniref:Translation initiation factor eIF2B subunit delta n=1 Tax=Paspalum notatum var. saurae TaxID=547442 RepID=A0AAQ3X225_PASNO